MTDLEQFFIGLIERAGQDTRMAWVYGESKWLEFLVNVADLAGGNPHPDTAENDPIVEELTELLVDEDLSEDMARMFNRRGATSILERTRKHFGFKNASDEPDVEVRVLRKTDGVGYGLYLVGDVSAEEQNLIEDEAIWKLLITGSEVGNAAGWCNRNDDGSSVISFPRHTWQAIKTGRNTTTAGHELAHAAVTMMAFEDFGREPDELIADLASGSRAYESTARFYEAVSAVAGRDVLEMLAGVRNVSDAVDFYVELEKSLGASHLLMLMLLKPSVYQEVDGKCWPLGQGDRHEKYLQSLLVDQLRRRGSDKVRQGIRDSFCTLEVSRAQESGWADRVFGLRVPDVVETEYRSFLGDQSRQRIGPITRQVAARGIAKQTVDRYLTASLSDEFTEEPDGASDICEVIGADDEPVELERSYVLLQDIPLPTISVAGRTL